jgi:acyl carrier protein
MPWADWLVVTQCKIQGTWNLHNAFLSEQVEPLDHFFLFSSTGASSGQPGQSNYHAGNTFLDSFVTYRHFLGLSASSLNIGLMGDVGYVAENQEILEQLRAMAQYVSSEPELLDCMELMLKRSSPLEGSTKPIQTPGITHYGARYVQRSQIGMGLRATLPISAPANRVVWRKTPRALVYRNLEAQENTASASSSSSDEHLKQFLRDVSSNITMLKAPQTTEFIATEIGKTVQEFTMKTDTELDIEAPLDTIGIDSLIGVELRSWIRKKLGTEMTTLEIMRNDNLRALGAMIQAKLVERYESRA